MKKIFLMILSAAAWAAEPAKMPETIHLTSGAVLRGVKVERWEKDKVVIRYVAGLAPIPFANIAEPDRTAVLAARPGLAPAPVTAPSGETEAADVTLNGQAFSGGADQPYRFAAMKIRIFSGASLSEDAREWPPEIGAAVADVDGKFSVIVPRLPVVIFAEFVRSYKNGNKAYYTWRVPVATAKDAARLMLTDDNARIVGEVRGQINVR